MAWDLTALETDEDTDWIFADTLPEARWSYAFQNIASSAPSGTGVFSGTEEDQLDWTPGHNGKGIVTLDNTVYTWNCYGPQQEPWHFEYAQDNNITRMAAQFYIDPDGGIYNMVSGADEDEDNRIRQVLRETDPNLNVGEGNTWSFSKVANLDGDVLNWSEGNYGKGIIDQYGNVHTWNEDDAWELHRDYEDAHDLRARFYFTIDPDGTVESADMTPLAPEVLDIINEADNGLHGDPQVAWSF